MQLLQGGTVDGGKDDRKALPQEQGTARRACTKKCDLAHAGIIAPVSAVPECSGVRRVYCRMGEGKAQQPEGG